MDFNIISLDPNCDLEIYDNPKVHKFGDARTFKDEYQKYVDMVEGAFGGDIDAWFGCLRDRLSQGVTDFYTMTYDEVLVVVEDVMETFELEQKQKIFETLFKTDEELKENVVE